jgi:ADP-heptose:LPS heptosyltransferase
MDIVVSIDTSVAHLAVSMGKPTLILLAFVADFRWLLKTEASPWYPSVKLYRQSRINSWDDALDRVKLDLENSANTRKFTK